MKVIKSLVLVLMLASVSLAAVHINKVDDEVRKELEAIYAKIDAASVAKDMETMESLLADDYEKREGDKTLNREEAIAEMKKSLESVKKIESSKTTIDKIEQVEGNYIVDYTMKGKAIVVGADGKDTVAEGTSKGRDWWVKDDDGKWHCVASEKL